MKKMALWCAAFSMIILSCKKEEYKNLKDGLYANIETDKGSILIKLEYQKAPITVANFVSLAEGKNNKAKAEYKGKPFFDGLTFHRVEPGFVIQGGDPDGNGAGGPGYNFADEFSDLKHDKVGTVSMANAGPGTNGSQFFITLSATPHLDNRHSVFGYVEQGLDVLDQITVGDKMNEVTIIRVGESAKKFKADKVFDNYFKNQDENIKKQKENWAKEQLIYKSQLQQTKAKKLLEFKEYKSTGTKLPSGVIYKIITKSNQNTQPGEAIKIKYSGFLEDGTLFDTSEPKVAKQFDKYIIERDIAKDYTSIPFMKGAKGQLVPGFEEVINKLNIGDKAVMFIPANQAYGENGAGDAIPPNANLIFEVELINK